MMAEGKEVAKDGHQYLLAKCSIFCTNHYFVVDTLECHYEVWNQRMIINDVENTI